MTAEVAVLNKLAVALAADSAVTFSTEGLQKINNAGNKVFSLSKREPVGIMVYGNAEFMGVPWETVIKVYRSESHGRTFDTVAGYYADFLKFLAVSPMFGAAEQDAQVRMQAVVHFSELTMVIRKRVQAEITEKGSIDASRSTEIAGEVVGEDLTSVLKLEFAVGMDADLRKRLPSAFKRNRTGP